MGEKPVYSSENKGAKEKNIKKKEDYKISKGPCKIRMEKKGRAGKTVTVIYDLPFSLKEAQALMKELQTYLACGATLKNSTIELRGENREKIKTFFQNKKITLKGL